MTPKGIGLWPIRSSMIWVTGSRPMCMLTFIEKRGISGMLTIGTAALENKGLTLHWMQNGNSSFLYISDHMDKIYALGDSAIVLEFGQKITKEIHQSICAVCLFLDEY